MAKASTYSDAPSSLQTRCTTCRTVFEVSPELLSSSDTRVRCGECLSIFDALANLRDGSEDDAEALDASADASDAASGDTDSGDEDAGALDVSDAVSRGGAEGEASDALAVELDEADRTLAGIGDDTGALDVTYADFDLFSGEAQLPEVAYLDETADTPDFDFDTVDVGDDADETFSDTLFAHDATIEPSSLDADATSRAGPPVSLDEEPDFVEDDGTVEPPVFRYRDADGTDAGDGAVSAAADPPDGTAAPYAPPLSPHPPSPAAPSSSSSGGSWALRTLMIVLFLSLLVGLYAYRGRDALHNDPLARPVLVAGCRVIGCTVPSRVDLDSLKLLDKKVFTHPSTRDALVINVAFRNVAAFDQRYPVLVVRLRDRVGRRVAERDFAPADYLDDWRAGDTLAAGRRLDISLEVDDPGDGADSYEFEFREAGG